jgi:NADH dehydrogenase/NADH:ubiquinone oxidoreductase subunit G
MTATTATAKRVATVYYVVNLANDEILAEAKRPELGRDKFAEIVAEDTTSHIVLRTAKGKVLEERPAAEAETVNIPGLGEVSAAGIAALKNVGAELKAVRESQEARAAKAEAEDDEDVLALLGDALADEDEQAEAPAADDEPEAEAIAEAPVEQAETRTIPASAVGRKDGKVARPKAEVLREAREAAKKTAAAPVAATGAGEVEITTYADMIGVFTTAVAKGEMGAGSLAGYKAGVRAVLKAQSTGLGTDLTKVDVEMAVEVFTVKTPGILSQTSKTYIADFKRAVTLYNLYLADPKNFKFPAKNIRATRLVATPAAPVATPAPAAKKTAAKVKTTGAKGKKTAKK